MYSHREYSSFAGLCQKMSEMTYDTKIVKRQVMRDASVGVCKKKKNNNKIARYLGSKQDACSASGGHHRKRARCKLLWTMIGQGVRRRDAQRQAVYLKIGDYPLKHWSVTQATMSLSPAKAEAQTITKRETHNLELWTDSLSARAISQRLGPDRRAKHLEVQTMRV